LLSRKMQGLSNLRFTVHWMMSINTKRLRD
jgi:hypothetical protein